jgi:hypothetical protein
MKCCDLLLSLFSLSALIMTGCSANPSIKFGNDRYGLYEEDYKGVFNSVASLKSDVINETNNFAKSASELVFFTIPETNHPPSSGAKN